VEEVPLVTSEAKNPSWPDAKAGWTLGMPPSEPKLSMLYLSNGFLLISNGHTD